MEASADRITPTCMVEARDLRSEVLAIASHLESLVAHLAKHGAADADALRRLAIATVEVEFSVRHRASIDPAVVRLACRNALELVEARHHGPARLLHARARAACRALVRRLTDDG
jgi:hypothetical protein